MSIINTLFYFYAGCPNATTCTFILRGGAEQFLEETERSLHDAIMIVRRTIKHDSVVAGKSCEKLITRRLFIEYIVIVVEIVMCGSIVHIAITLRDLLSGSIANPIVFLYHK